MMPFMLRHLLESTLFCVLLISLACCLRTGANARYAVWLIGISKFAIPSILLAAIGARLAFLWPAAPWLSSVTNEFLAVVAHIEGMLPLHFVNLDAGTVRIIALLWITGTTLRIIVWFARLRSSNSPLTLPTRWEQEAMDRANALLPVRAPVLLRSSDGSVEPALRGIWRPIVTIPEGLSQRLTAAEFEAVLLHELAHARRFDNLTAVFVHAMVCVFWFHPLLWMVERRINIERERACDEFVIACGITPRIYASGIVKVCKFHIFEAPGISAMTGSDLKHRLELILESDFSKPLLYVPRLLIAGVAFLMTMVPLAGGYCGQCVSGGQASTFSSPSSGLSSCKPHGHRNQPCSN